VSALDCPHGEEAWYCDACAYQREKSTATELETLRVRADLAEAALAEAREVLAECAKGDPCPLCGGLDSDLTPKHAPDCRLAKVLGT
jgi:hypothetical protein